MERVFIKDLTPITHVEPGSKILVDQNGYKKISYENFVVEIVGTMTTNHNQWNASSIDSVNVNVNGIQNREVLVYSTATQTFINRRLDADDLTWHSIDPNQSMFLKIGQDGRVKQSHIQTNSIYADNNHSAGFFLRIKDDGSGQVELEQFNPNEFTINAQTLDGNTIGDLDTRFLNSSNNLSDLTDVSQAVAVLGVITETQADAKYLSKAANLSDVVSAVSSFDNIKQPATISYAGVTQFASPADTASGVRSDVAVTPSGLSSSYFSKTESDGRFMRGSNNLNDVNNLNAARNNLNVYSRSEADNRYLQAGLNLTELTNTSIARNSLNVYSRTEGDNRYLLETSNLSDLSDIATARSNLDVYSTSQTYSVVESDERFYRNKLLETENLNNVLEMGIYHQINPSEATIPRNYPVASAAGVLEVIREGTNPRFAQRFTTTTGLSSPRVFVRSFNLFFGPWREVTRNGGDYNWTYLSQPFQVYNSVANTSGWLSIDISGVSASINPTSIGELFLSWSYNWENTSGNRGTSWATIRGSTPIPVSINEANSAMMRSGYNDSASRTYSTSGAITLPFSGDNVILNKQGDADNHRLRIFVQAWRLL